MDCNFWYAVLRDGYDNDWRYGSESYKVAVKMALRYGQDSRIAVIYGGENPVCLKVIKQDDF